MELRDLIVTPLLIVIVCIIGYYVRPFLTDETTKKYFFPALALKVIGAIAVGLLYQFYYKGGDTYNFHTQGSRHIWEAFVDSPMIAWELLTSNGYYSPGTYTYASKIIFFQDPASYFIVKVAAFFDLFTFSSYSATAVCFSLLSFAGGWMLFLTFYERTPTLHQWQAAATLFIPSVIFWGSGLMKDTLTFAAIGSLTYSINYLLLKRKFSVTTLVVLVLSIWVLFSVKKYILLCYLPAALLWIYIKKLAQIPSLMLKLLVTPFVVATLILSGYYAVILIGEDDPRYSLDRLAITARITAYDIGFYSGRDAGSGYSLGELDGTFSGMLSKVPEAINVTLFRPYLWEIRNPLMLLSAFESFVLIVLTIYVVLRKRLVFFKALGEPTVIFCLVFSLTFAFAVGVSTFNFGTLARYKIPLLPFYVLALGYILNYSNKERKLLDVEATE
jgi:hypothetical protein